MKATTESLRYRLLTDAAVEVESIACVLQARFQTVEAELQFVRGLAIRLESLAGVVLDACNDRPIDDALMTLEGPEASRRRRREAA
jgi:hypothetical protein